MKNKKEMYDWLATDCDVYILPIKYANIYYVRIIVKGSEGFFYSYA